MLKRRPSKRFVLAETGEESAWNTTIDNDPVQDPSQPPPVVPSVEIGMVKSPSSGQIEETKEEVPPPKSKPQLLRVPQLATPGLK